VACRVSLVALREHPTHTSACKLGHFHTKRLTCRLLSGSRYVFRIMSVLFLICTQFWIYATVENTGLVFTQLYSFPRRKHLLVTQKGMTSNMEARSRISLRKLSLLRVYPVFSEDSGEFPSHEPLMSLSKPPLTGQL
jgi:hypothetical protein